MSARELREKLAVLAEADAVVGRVVGEVLELAREVGDGDRAGVGVLLEVAEVVGRSEQARHGQLIQLLGQVDRIGAGCAGLACWIATRLDVSDGRARAMAQAAKRIGAVPELAPVLSSGRVGADTVRVLARTVKAVEGTGHDSGAALAETLKVAEHEGVGAANRRVRVLEHTIDPDSSQELLGNQRGK